MSANSDTVINLAKIVEQMVVAGLEKDFVANVLRLAVEDEGVAHLMELWPTAPTPQDRDEIVADLQEALDDEEAPPGPQRR